MNQRSTTMQGIPREQPRGVSIVHSDTQGPDTGLRDLGQGLAKDAGTLANGMKDLADSVAEDAKSAFEAQINSQKDRVVGGLGGVAQALRQVTSTQPEKSPIAPAVVPWLNQAADRMQDASEYFERNSFSDMAHDLEGFARREPALFLGAAFTVGLIGGRFLKASPPRSGRSTRTPRSPKSLGGSAPTAEHAPRSAWRSEEAESGATPTTAGTTSAERSGRREP